MNTAFLGSPLSRRALVGGLVAAPFLVRTPPAAARNEFLSPSPAPTSTAALPAAGQGFLLGMYCSNLRDVTNLESVVGRPFHGTTHYRDCNAWTAWPTADERPLVDRGNLVRYPLESRVFNYRRYTPPAGVPAPTWRHTNPADGQEYAGYRHVDFTSGSLDRLLDNIADGVRSLPGTVLFDYDHEMDDNRYVLARHHADWGPITYNRSAAYTNPASPDPQEFIDAHRYIVSYLRAAGVRNMLFGFCPAGWTLGRNADRLASLYPGDSYVDVIMWDPYNGHGAWRSFSQIVSPMYSAIDDHLYGSGARSKARFLGEFGCRYRDARRAGWIRDMASEVRDFPALRGGAWFSSGSWGSIHGAHLTAAERPRLHDLVNSSYLNGWKGARRMSPHGAGG